MTDFLIPVAPEALPILENDQDKMDAVVAAASSFREFLRYWTFIDQRTGQACVLGEDLWEGQLVYLDAFARYPRVFLLKARKLGATTIGAAYDAWVARFRDTNCRVHLFSRRDDAAIELLAQVKYGLDRLPEWMRLPYGTANTHELELFAGPDDQRLIKAYPTSEETAVEATCTHGHIDEWARMKNPEAVWQAVEPSLAGSCHIITTGRGPANYPARFWRRSKDGLTGFVAVFTNALSRPDRDKAWLEGKRLGMTEKQFRQEYAMTDQDALFGGGDFVFDGSDVDWAGKGSGEAPAIPGHKYIKAWDIGRHADASVGIVLDLDSTPHQVVHYDRLRGVTFPLQQAKIESVHGSYPGLTRIEKNSFGEAVLENLDIVESQLDPFTTTKPSKARIISKLELSLEHKYVQWSADQWPQLDEEVRGYQIPDDSVVQDSVMTLAMANDVAVGGAPQKGRVGRVVSW